MTTGEDLKETYFRRRRQSEGLRRFTSLFEGQPWYAVGKTQRSDGEDGSKLLVYAVANGVVVSVITVDGAEHLFLDRYGRGGSGGKK